MAKRKRKKRDLGLVRHARYLSVVDVGPVGIALGNAVKALREAAGMSHEALAGHIGGTARWLQAVEAGKSMLTQEAAYRIYKVIFGRETWRDAPNLRGLGERIDPGYNVRVTFFDEEILQRWRAFAAATGCTMSAVARYALERLFDHEPTLTTIKEGIDIAEKMRAQSLLESCPEYVGLLKADPLLAKVIAAKAPGWKSVADDSKSLAIEKLQPSPRDDGLATPIERLK